MIKKIKWWFIQDFWGGLSGGCLEKELDNPEKNWHALGPTLMKCGSWG